MRAAVVSSGDFGSWDERGALLSHFVGALACVADVDLLVANGPTRRTEPEGAATREVFPTRPPAPDRLRALELLAAGPQFSSRAPCGCTGSAQRALLDELPSAVEEELVSLAGGDSPALLDHLVSSSYDLVAFTGADTASTTQGLQALEGRAATLLLPLVRPGPRLSLQLVRDAFAKADLVVTASAFEASLAVDAGASRVTTIGSVLRVHELARRNEPLLFEDGAVVVARDWAAAPPTEDLLLTVRRLNRDLITTTIRLIGPGWRALPEDVRAPHVESRFDVWRWVARSMGLWDPEPGRLLSREVLEAMQYGTPVITPWDGAGREHAERGNGGLWYRTYDELLACIQALAGSDELVATLGAQGQAYSVRNFADTDAYVERVAGLVSELVMRPAIR